MVRSIPASLWWAGLVLVMPLDASAAQDTLRLRFAPPDETSIVIAFQTHTRASQSGSPAAELADLGHVTGVPLGMVDGAHVVHLRYDSVRVRSRQPHAQWRERRPAVGDSGWSQIRLDDRMRVVAVSGWQRAGLTDPIALLTGVRDLELPDRPLRAGDRWHARPSVRVPHVPGTAMTGGKLVADALVTLDSIVARPYDTLGFVTVQGAIHRTTVVDPVGARRVSWSYSGDLAGSLVWSTGWNVFVSGTNRSRVSASKHATRAADRGAETLAWETTTRYRVQP